MVWGILLLFLIVLLYVQNFKVILLASITFIILYAHHHYFQNSFITQTETQYTLNNNSPLPSILVPSNLDSILKSRHITLLTKVHIVNAMVFRVVMYGCESWTLKKAECWRTDAFELWCWRRLLRVPKTTRRSSQSILKEIYPEYSLEELVWKLKLQYSGHLMQRADSLEKTLMLGKIEGRRRRWQHPMRWLDNITGSLDMSLSKLQEIVEDRGAWHAAVPRVKKNWT